MHLILIGPPGSGKSRAISALRAVLQQFGIRMIFTTQTPIGRVRAVMEDHGVILNDETT